MGNQNLLLHVIFLLPVTMQSRQIEISRNRKRIQQCAVKKGTLFSCIWFRMRYDGGVTKKKKERTSVQPKTLFSPKLPAAAKPQQIIHVYDTTVLCFMQAESYKMFG